MSVSLVNPAPAHAAGGDANPSTQVGSLRRTLLCLVLLTGCLGPTAERKLDRVDSVAATSTGTASDADTDTDSDTDADADADSDTDSDADADSDTDSDADADSDTDSDADADSDTDSDTDTTTCGSLGDNSPQTALPALASQLGQLGGTDGSDHYWVNVSAWDQLEVQLISNDPALQVRAWDATGALLDASFLNGELLWYNRGADEQIVVEVFGAPSVCVTYGLEVSADHFCEADDQEPDDDATTATVVPPVDWLWNPTERYQGTLEDVDVFLYDLPAFGSVTFDPDSTLFPPGDTGVPTAATIPLRMEVYLADGTLYDSTDSSGDPISVNFVPQQRLRVELHRLTDYCADYTFTVR